jgi:hypothetical protein
MKKHFYFGWVLMMSGVLLSCGGANVKGEGDEGSDLYVSPTGKGTDGAGTKAKSFHSWLMRLPYSIQVNTIYLMEGTYRLFLSDQRWIPQRILLPSASASEMKTLMPEDQRQMALKPRLFLIFPDMTFQFSQSRIEFQHPVLARQGF